MDSALRPMSTAEVLDRTFHLYRTHFVTLAGIGLLLPALYLILKLAFLQSGYISGSANPPSGGNDLALSTLYGVCAVLIFVFGYSLVSGAAFHAVSRLHLGQKVTIVESYKRVFTRFPTVLRIVMTVCIRTMGPILVAFLTFAGILAMIVRTSTRRSAIYTTLVVMSVTFLLGGIWALYIYIKYSMAVAACLAEKLRARDALKRSRLLSLQSRFRIFLIFLLMGIIGLALNAAFTAPSQVYSIMHHGKLTVPWVLWEYIGGFMAAVVAGPISTIAIALVYYDQRVRKEAFDLQFMMEGLEQREQGQAAASAI